MTKQDILNLFNKLLGNYGVYHNYWSRATNDPSAINIPSKDTRLNRAILRCGFSHDDYETPSSGFWSFLDSKWKSIASDMSPNILWKPIWELGMEQYKNEISKEEEEEKKENLNEIKAQPYKTGDIVYAWDLHPEKAILTHFSRKGSENRFLVCSLYSNAVQQINEVYFKNVTTPEEYHKVLKKPKDKDLVWAWDNCHGFAKSVGFYDAENKKIRGIHHGSRTGTKYENYEVIPREQWPQWAIEAFDKLKD